MRRKIVVAWLAGLATFVSGLALAQDTYPSKPIEIVVHRGGGSTHLGGKIAAEFLQAGLGVPVVMLSKPAGAGSAAPTYVASAKPDGYTLFVANSGTNGTMPHILPVQYKNTDFEYLALYGTQPMVLVVKNDAPWKNVQELVAEAKKNPGKLKYSTSSVGAQSHFVMEHFKLAAGGIKIDQVPFKGAPESVAALLGGHVHVASTYLVDVKGHVDAGTVRILAVPEPKRLEMYPNVPTFAESGYAEVISTAWFGIGAPRGLPKHVSDRLKTELAKVISDPEFKKKLIAIGYTPVYKDADAFTKFVFGEEKLFAKIAKDASIRVD